MLLFTVSLHLTVLTLRGSDNTFKCIEQFVLYLNVINGGNRNWTATGKLLTDKVVRAIISPCIGWATSKRQVT